MGENRKFLDLLVPMSGQTNDPQMLMYQKHNKQNIGFYFGISARALHIINVLC